MKIILGVACLYVAMAVSACVISRAQEPPPVAPPDDLVGRYRCEGENPDGSRYQGVTDIVRVQGTYRVRWTMEDGAITGVGIYSGGVFAVSYFGGAPAVVVYTVDGDTLVGEWTMGGAEGRTYQERLTKDADAVVPASPPRDPHPARDHNRL